MEFYMNSFLKIDDLVTITKLSKSTLNRLIQNDEFPQPAKIGRCAVWGNDQINNWINNKLTTLKV